jgi:hypothetical protein
MATWQNVLAPKDFQKKWSAAWAASLEHPEQAVAWLGYDTFKQKVCQYWEMSPSKVQTNLQLFWPQLKSFHLFYLVAKNDKFNCVLSCFSSGFSQFFVPMEEHALKDVNNCLNTNIYSYLKTSGGQSFNLYLNAIHFSTPVLIRHLWQLKTTVFLHRCLICTVPL